MRGGVWWGAIEMGAGQGWAEHNARVSVGHRSFWEPAQPPPGGPSGVQGYMVSARQVHLPCYLCPAHASTLLSPAPSAPYGNDLLLPDLAARLTFSMLHHGFCVSCATVRPAALSLQLLQFSHNASLNLLLLRDSLHSQRETVVDRESELRGHARMAEDASLSGERR